MQCFCFETAKLTGDSKNFRSGRTDGKLISVSENLTEKGMHHKIGWYDQKKEQLCMEEIDSADNLAQIIHGLLSLERKNIHRLAGICTEISGTAI